MQLRRGLVDTIQGRHQVAPNVVHRLHVERHQVQNHLQQPDHLPRTLHGTGSGGTVSISKLRAAAAQVPPTSNSPHPGNCNAPYICKYICMYVCIYIYICIYTYACICICMYIYINMYVYVYICMYMYIYIYANVCKCIYIYIYIYIYICMYMCIYMCMHMYVYDLFGTVQTRPGHLYAVYLSALGCFWKTKCSMELVYTCTVDI